MAKALRTVQMLLVLSAIAFYFHCRDITVQADCPNTQSAQGCNYLRVTCGLCAFTLITYPQGQNCSSCQDQVSNNNFNMQCVGNRDGYVCDRLWYRDEDTGQEYYTTSYCYTYYGCYQVSSTPPDDSGLYSQECGRVAGNPSTSASVWVFGSFPCN